MAGVIPRAAFRTPRLTRFGYVTLTAGRDGLLGPAGTQLPAHEFHYWDSENCGSGFTAVKESNGRRWDCVHTSAAMYAGFPHLYFYADIRVAERFVEACAGFGGKYGI